MTPDDMTSTSSGPRNFTEKEMIEMWPQAAGELRGYATHLMGRGIGITSAQMFMAVQMADAFLATLKDRQKNTAGG